MNLNDLFQDLALGELSNLSMVENNTIIPGRRPKIVSYANEALLALHSKFVLKEKDLLIEMREGVTNYHLLKRYAMSHFDKDNPPDRWNMPYILDMVADPFQEDVIKILSVYNSFNEKLPLNDQENSCSVFSPQSNLLQVPSPIPGQALAIEYQAKHPPLTHCQCEDEIQLPDVLWRALKAYVAAKTCSHMNTQEMTAKGQEHMLIYETICQEVIDRDLVNTSSSTTNTRFQKRGWI